MIMIQFEFDSMTIVDCFTRFSNTSSGLPPFWPKNTNFNPNINVTTNKTDMTQITKKFFFRFFSSTRFVKNLLTSSNFAPKKLFPGNRAGLSRERERVRVCRSCRSWRGCAKFGSDKSDKSLLDVARFDGWSLDVGHALVLCVLPGNIFTNWSALV